MTTRMLSGSAAPATDPRTAALLAAARLGIRVPASGAPSGVFGGGAPPPAPAARVGMGTDPAIATAARLGIAVPAPAPGQIQGAPGGSTASAGINAQPPPSTQVRPGTEQQQPGEQQAIPPPGAQQQMTPQAQAMADSLRDRMGLGGMADRMGANRAALTPAQNAILAARNMTDDRGVFAGQQTGAVMPPYRGPQ